MSSELPKCKITVLKRIINQDLIDEYLEDSYREIGLCECFEEGQGYCNRQRFIVESTMADTDKMNPLYFNRTVSIYPLAKPQYAS